MECCTNCWDSHSINYNEEGDEGCESMTMSLCDLFVCIHVHTGDLYTNYKVLFVETEDPWTKVIWMKL